jgi:hypothetical protein
MKESLKEVYMLRLILESELSVRNKVTTIGALAVPILRYNFSTVNWRLEETENRPETRKVTKMFTIEAMCFYE